jgi:hypothetical protein
MNKHGYLTDFIKKITLTGRSSKSLSIYLCKHVGMPSRLFHDETLFLELGLKVMLVGSPSHQIFYIQHYQDERSGSNTTLIQHYMSYIYPSHVKKSFRHLTKYTTACYICSVPCHTSCGTG